MSDAVIPLHVSDPTAAYVALAAVDDYLERARHVKGCAAEGGNARCMACRVRAFVLDLRARLDERAHAQEVENGT